MGPGEAVGPELPSFKERWLPEFMSGTNVGQLNLDRSVSLVISIA